jgi:hypothetical protein
MSPFIKPKPELSRPLLPHEGVARAIALYDFRAAQVSLKRGPEMYNSPTRS